MKIMSNLNMNDFHPAELSCLGETLKAKNQKRLTLLDERMISTEDYSEFRINSCQEDCISLGALIYIPVRNIKEPGIPRVGQLLEITPVCNDFYRLL